MLRPDPVSRPKALNRPLQPVKSAVAIGVTTAFLLSGLMWPALLTQAAEPTTTTTTALATGPQISFGTTVCAFGLAWSGEEVTCTFAFSNTGTQDLKIVNVKPACGCTQVGAWDEIVAPGRRGHLAFRLHTRGLAGQVQRFVQVTTNATGRTQLTLQLSGEVKPLFDLPALQLAFGRVTRGQAGELRRLQLNSRCGQPVSITGCAGSDPAFAPALRVIEPGKKFELAVRLNAQARPGAHAGEIRLLLASPYRGILSVPVSAWISAWQVQPAVIELPACPWPQAQVRAITCSYLGDAPAKGLDAETNVPDVQIDFAEHPSSTSQTLRITFQARPDLPPGQNYWVRIKSGDEKAEPFLLPVRIQQYPGPQPAAAR